MSILWRLCLGTKMTGFKIGDQVKLKGCETILGYVSHVHKGYLFSQEDNDVRVKLTDGELRYYKTSELEFIRHFNDA